MSTRISPVLVAVAAALAACRSDDAAPTPAAFASHTPAKPETPPAPLPAIVTKGIDWLVAAQQQEGGWGGGSHAQQENRDPHAVPADPGTTAFAAMALVRAGHTPTRGEHKDAVARATDYLLAVVEAAPVEGPFITDIRGTQPQSKMGQQVDTALASQYFTRLLPEVRGTKLEARVTAALDKCVRKIEGSQTENGSWAMGGWAPVLQSSLMTNALETAAAADREVDGTKLAQAKAWQRDLVGGGGAVSTDAAAGVTLYAAASNARANASEAKRASDIVAKGKAEGRLPASAPVDEKSLRQLGVEAPEASALAEATQQSELAKSRMFDEQMLAGFGNNGGEEFLSYMMKSESLVIDRGEEWTKWNSNMHERLAKVQNQDGSWSGHHCITSPVFCTAAAVACLTAERDSELLAKAAVAKAK